MTNFPKPVLHYWYEAFAGDANSTWAVSEPLNTKRPGMMLEEGIDGCVRTVLRCDPINRVSPDASGVASIADIPDLVKCGGVSLHDPDHPFYRSADAPVAFGRSMATHQLTFDDRDTFEAFQADASQLRRDDAFIELNDRAMFGCFDGVR